MQMRPTSEIPCLRILTIADRPTGFSARLHEVEATTGESRFRPFPEFVCVGPQRTGSTWLDRALRSCGKIVLPDSTKETFFFDDNFGKGIAWYRSHFQQRFPGLVGEIGPSYFDVPEACSRICSLNPGCRILVILRDPAERGFSLFLHHLKKGRVPSNLREACERMPRLLSSGQYQRHTSRWIETFGRESVLILRYEDIAKDPHAVLRSVASFLGIGYDFIEVASEERINASSLPRFPWLARQAARLVSRLKSRRLHGVVDLGKRLGLKKVYSGASAVPTLSLEDREWLIEQHLEAIDYCERELGWDVADWRKVPTAA